MILGHVEVFDFEPGVVTMVTMVGLGDLYVVSRIANLLRSLSDDERWLQKQHQRSFDGQGK